MVGWVFTGVKHVSYIRRDVLIYVVGSDEIHQAVTIGEEKAGIFTIFWFDVAIVELVHQSL